MQSVFAVVESNVFTCSWTAFYVFFSQWSHCLEKPITGTIGKLAWSSDGTQFACACTNGQVLFAQVVDRWRSYHLCVYTFQVCYLTHRHLEWHNLEVVVGEDSVIRVKDVLTEAEEQLGIYKSAVQSASLNCSVVVTMCTLCIIYTPLQSYMIELWRWRWVGVTWWHSHHYRASYTSETLYWNRKWPSSLHVLHVELAIVYDMYYGSLCMDSSCNWTTPITFDMKTAAVGLLLMTDRHFLMADNITGIQVYSYEVSHTCESLPLTLNLTHSLSLSLLTHLLSHCSLTPPLSLITYT